MGGLAENDFQWGFGGVGFRGTNLDFHVLLAGTGNGCGVVVAITVEKQQLLSRLHAQYPAHMLCGVVIKCCGAALGEGGIGVDAGYAHELVSQIPGGCQSRTAISMPSVATWPRWRICSSVIT